MKTIGQLVLLILVVALVASTSCYFTGRYMRSVPGLQQNDFHHWLHEQLGLTAEQNKALDIQERAFEATKKEIGSELQVDNAELAQALILDRAYSPRVQLAIEKIHHAESKLEEATMQHIFSMRPILTPEQFDKVLQLTGETLQVPPQP